VKYKLTEILMFILTDVRSIKLKDFILLSETHTVWRNAGTSHDLNAVTKYLFKGTVTAL